jgi:hypothetical protein
MEKKKQDKNLSKQQSNIINIISKPFEGLDLVLKLEERERRKNEYTY